ncbi:hypothetical protein HDU76_004184, partial [Blyttiomyces sp. JEL0837]
MLLRRVAGKVLLYSPQVQDVMIALVIFLLLNDSIAASTSTAAKTFVVMLDTPKIEPEDSFNVLAMKGCEMVTSEYTDYKCKWILWPDDTVTYRSITQWYIDSIANDTSIVHVLMQGYSFGTLFEDIANAFPEITFSFNDGTVDSVNIPNAQGIIYSEDEAGFLAGVIAGSLTNTSIVGSYGNYPIGPITRYIQGFLKGVYYVKPTATVLTSYNADPTWGNETLAVQLAQAAGSLGSKGIHYAAQQKVWVIGVDSDESESAFFSNTSDIASQYMFASALKRVDVATSN